MNEESDAWRYQWNRFQDSDDEILLRDWIAPVTLDDLIGKDLLECGCGGGQQTVIFSRVAKSVLAFDPSTADIARKRCAGLDNVSVVNADLLSLDLRRTFDVVACIAVIQHTANPDKAFESIYRHCKPGGLILLWCYSREGNGIVRYIVEPLRKYILRFLPRNIVQIIGWIATMLAIVLAHTFYRLPLPLPATGYAKQVRKLSFKRNFLNIFDKLNAPRTNFISRERIEHWFSNERFSDVTLRHHAGISWSCVGTKRI